MPEAFKKVRNTCLADFFFAGVKVNRLFVLFFLCARPVYESCSTKESSNMKTVAVNLGVINDLLVLYLTACTSLCQLSLLLLFNC